MNKKILAGLLAAGLLVSAVACGDVTETTTGTGEKPLETTTQAGETTSAQAGGETTTTAPAASETTTTGNTETPPVVNTTPSGIERVKVGQYITLQYNADAVRVTWEVKKGVGSRETVTFTVKQKDSHLFEGWSVANALVSGGTLASEESTYTVNATEDMMLFCNTVTRVMYHPNGGVFAESGSADGVLTDRVSSTSYQNPNSLPDQGQFKREGYTLVGYNTMPDGLGEDISLGSKVTVKNQGKIDLYCVWAKTAEASDFAYEEKSGGIAITGYKGSETETLAIPETIGGKSVTTIAGGAFAGASMEKVLLPKTVKTVEKGAFSNCKELETAIFYDGITSFSDDAFDGCEEFENVRIHTTTYLLNEWYSSSAAKIDRLIWAKDKKKVIIIGGSGSLMGYDSAVLDEALYGQYEIINFGENANITSLLYFDIVKEFVQEGDIILWSPEPGGYTLGNHTCSSRFWGFRKSNYDFTKYIELEHYDNFFSSFASYCKDLATKTSFRGYDMLPAGMNPYGDDSSSRKWNGSRFDYNFRYRMEAEVAMADLFEEIKAEGAEIYFSFAAMQESGIARVNTSEIENFEKLVTSVGAVSISDYENCIYADDMFSDSAWHLTDEGAHERAGRVAEDLKKAIGLD